MRALIMIKERLKHCSTKTLCLSIWCAIGFMGIGSITIVISPTLLDLAAKLGVTVAQITIVLTVRQVASIIGYFVSGFCYDKFKRPSFWVIIALLFAEFIVTSSLPYSVNLYMLGVMLLVFEFFSASIDNGMHTVLIRVLRQKSGPSMQLIHFALAFGFFLTPIIAKPFVTPNSFDNKTNQSNCSIVNESGSWQSGSGPVFKEYNHFELHCKNSTLNTNNSSSLFFGWVYMISAFPLLLPIPVFIFFGIKSQCTNETSRYICTQTDSTTVEDEEDTEQKDDSNTLEDTSKDSLFDISKDSSLVTSENSSQTLLDVPEQQESKPHLYPDSLLYKFLALMLIALFTFFYVGYEMTFFTFFFTYAVKSDLNFSKPKASLLLSLQNGMFALFRLISIGIFLLKPPLEPIMFTSLAGVFTSSLVMIIWRRTEIVIWVIAGVYGMFLGPIYPMMVTWLSSHAPSNAKGLSVVMIAGRLGLFVHFILVGELIENYPPILLFVTSSGSSITLLIFIAMTVLVKTWDKKCKCSQVYYHRMDDTNNEIEMTDMSSETSL